MRMLDRIIGEDIQTKFVPDHDIGRVFVDRGLIEQVVFNICVNARDAMPHGGSLTISTERLVVDEEFHETNPWAIPGRYVLMTVTDTGVGMDSETSDHIFEPFYSTKGDAAGTGLGLSTVYGTIQQHHGTIRVYSQPGSGTTFKVYLPETDRQEEPILSDLARPAKGGSEHILVAEDEPRVLDLTRRMLEDAGYTVTHASDGEAALEVYVDQRESIDLLILDVVMPKLGGKEVYDAIRGLGSEVPILFVSGYSESFLHPDFATDPSLAVVRKPFRREELLHAVRAMLSSRKRFTR